MRNYTILDDSAMDPVNAIPFQLPLHALFASRSYYQNYPKFQREEVWPDRFKFELIDSLVRGAYVPDILVTSMPNTASGERLYWVLDGQQRLETMLEFMCALEADTAAKPIPRDEHGDELFYFRLTERQQARLRARNIKFTELTNVTGSLLSLTFLRLQNSVPLTTAEKLWASPSSLTDVTTGVYRHPFFTTLYDGSSTRKKPFQMAMYPGVVEMFAPFADMNSVRLKALASGTRRELVYPDMEETIRRRLDLVTHLFSGVKVGSMSELIIMYQAVWLLEWVGADLAHTPEGVLRAWYAKIEELNKESRKDHFMNLFALMPNAKVQKNKWREWIPEIVYGRMVNIPDTQATDAQMQRLTGWLRENGICPRCHSPHVKLSEVTSHVFRPADEHNPALSTCVAKLALARR